MVLIVSSMKGGTGKSTLAFHLSVEACLSGLEIITYDLDYPQYSFSKYYENRNANNFKTWQHHHKVNNILTITKNQLKKTEEQTNLVIIDTPGKYDRNLIEVHKLADIIVTPINDSFIDVDTIMEIKKENWGNFGHYYEYIYEAQKHNENIEWIILQNKCSTTASNHSKNIKSKLTELSKKLGFRLIPGTKERSIYKELFTQGATVLDMKKKLSISNMAAKFEIKSIWQQIYKKILHKAS